MDDLDDATKIKIWDILHVFSPVQSLCRCYGNFTVGIHIEDILDMSNNEVNINGAVISVNQCSDHFFGIPIHEKKCECDILQNCQVILPRWAWETVICDNSDILLAGALWDGEKISVMHEQAAIIPLLKHSWSKLDINEDRRSVTCFEMFSGGFGGWSHAIKAIEASGLKIRTAFALDRHQGCAWTFAKSHSFDFVISSPSQYRECSHEWNNQHEGSPQIVFNTAMENMWWLSVVGKFATSMWVMSPPCPPWSSADKALGLLRMDGRCLIWTLMCVALHRPPVILLENVATLKSHCHWKIILEVFKHIQYQIKWIQSLDLADIIPHKRDRMILIAIDAHGPESQSFKCQPWPFIQKPSFRTYGVTLELDEFWKKHAVVSQEEMKMYLDPNNLPKDARLSGHVKRSKRDVVKYRLRGLDDQASCIMTSYGQPLSLFEPLVQRGGIYGCLFLDGDQPRKLIIPEIALLFGLLDRCWLPLDYSASMMYMGNAIAIPHALIALLNGIMYVDSQFTDIPLQECFADIMSQHVSNRNICIDFQDEGIWISKGQKSDISEAATQPMLSFTILIVQTPIGTVCIRCQMGLKIMLVRQAVMGASIPGQIDIHCGTEKGYHMPVLDHMIVDTHTLKVHANVMSRLLLDEKNFALTDAPIIVVLTPDSPMCLMRQQNMEVQDVLLALRIQFDNEHEWTLFGLSKQPLDLRERCPNFIFAIVKPCIRPVLPVGDCVGLLSPIVDALAWQGPVEKIDDLIHIIRQSATDEFLSCMGWHFTQGLMNLDDRKLFLTPKPGILHTPLEMARMMMITRVFIATIPQVDDIEGTFTLRIKVWDTWLWKGNINQDTIGDDILKAWDFASMVVGFHINMRIVINGASANPEWKIRQFGREDKDSIDLYLIPMLHGGGRSSETVSVRDSGEDSGSESSESVPEILDPISLEATDMQSAVSQMLEDFLALDCPAREFDLDSIKHFRLLADPHKLVAYGAMPQLIEFMKYMAYSGMEKILDYIGWHVALQFVEFSPPTRVRLLIMPIPGRRHATVTLAGGFIHSALTIMAMPIPETMSSRRVHVKIKIWNVWAYDAWLDENMICQVLLHSWETTAVFLGAQLRLRMVVKGKKINPDFALKRYATEDAYGERILKIFLVLELHGGGPSTQATSEQTTKAKNAVASLLLDHGCDLQTVSTFTHKLVHSVGPMSIDHIMKQKDLSTKVHAIQTMADALNLKFPDVTLANQQRDKQTQKKITKKMPVADVYLNPADFQVKSGFLLNEDDTPAVQKESIRGSSTGFVLLDPEAARPWITSSGNLSSDELAVIVVGRCPHEDTQRCDRIGLPVFNKMNQPMILDCCLHQLGAKKLKTSSLKQCDIDICDTSVLAFTIFKDEVETKTWSNMTKSPFRTIFDILATLDMHIQLPTPPWGRSWRNSKGPSSPEQAESFQCHARIETKKRNDLLRISGQTGLYVTPKDGNKQVDSDFGIIWMDMPLEQLRVLASTYPKGLGLIKVVKNKSSKISRGIRVSSNDFSDAFKHFKPTHDIPDMINVTVVAKLSPIPVGAGMEDVKKWLKLIGWKAKPIRPLRQDAWLLGFEGKIEDQFVKWGETTMLLTWLPDRKETHKSHIIAGEAVKSQAGTNQDNQDVPFDPWMAYINKQKSGKEQPPTGGKSGDSMIPQRSVDGPTETRFRKHEEQIDELKLSMQKMSQQLEQHQDEQQQMQVQVTSEFQAVRHEIAKSVEESTKKFEQTLEHSLRRQDGQLQAAFSELKAIIQSSPRPEKKAKVVKPPNNGEEEMDS